MPAPLQNCPGGQAKHAANEEFPPLTLPKLPGGQGEGAAAPVPHHAPAGHLPPPATTVLMTPPPPGVLVLVPPAQYHPAVQSALGATSPDEVHANPGVQGVHSRARFNPLALENVPGEQGVGESDPAPHHPPGPHILGAVVAGDGHTAPGGHGAQSVPAIAPPLDARNVPGAHAVLLAVVDRAGHTYPGAHGPSGAAFPPAHQLPASQSTQSDSAPPPVRGLYVPAGQGCGAAAARGQYAPVGHAAYAHNRRGVAVGNVRRCAWRKYSLSLSLLHFLNYGE